jgi:NADH dehydrogenase (ubiquinone) Fe-S protein 1
VRGTRAGKSEAKFVYLLGADDLTPADIPEDAFVVYQGHHGDRSAYRENVILPGAAFVFYVAIFTKS